MRICGASCNIQRILARHEKLHKQLLNTYRSFESCFFLLNLPHILISMPGNMKKKRANLTLLCSCTWYDTTANKSYIHNNRLFAYIFSIYLKFRPKEIQDIAIVTWERMAAARIHDLYDVRIEILQHKLMIGMVAADITLAGLHIYLRSNLNWENHLYHEITIVTRTVITLASKVRWLWTLSMTPIIKINCSHKINLFSWLLSGALFPTHNFRQNCTETYSFIPSVD